MNKQLNLPNILIKNFKIESGFTLIELLVVIAIIGILAGIVLVALGGAMDRAKDARIQSEMNQFRSAAFLAYSTDGNYSNVDCTNTTYGFNQLCSDINTQNGAAGGPPNIVKSSTNDAYCAEAALNSGKFCCVDSVWIFKCDYTTNPSCEILNLDFTCD